MTPTTFQEQFARQSWPYHQSSQYTPVWTNSFTKLSFLRQEALSFIPHAGLIHKLCCPHKCAFLYMWDCLHAEGTIFYRIYLLNTPFCLLPLPYRNALTWKTAQLSYGLGPRYQPEKEPLQGLPSPPLLPERTFCFNRQLPRDRGNWGKRGCRVCFCREG